MEEAVYNRESWQTLSLSSNESTLRGELQSLPGQPPQHLLLLGPQGETVVETGIAAAAGDNVVAFAKDQKNAEA